LAPIYCNENRKEKMNWLHVAYALVALLLVFTGGIALWNRFFRKQVFLVLDPSIGSDTNQPDQPKQQPSNLADLQHVASNFKATIASLDQVMESAAAGAEQAQWGWLYTPQAYVAAMVTQNAHNTDLPSALQCASNTAALMVNPCMLSIANPTNPTYVPCAGDSAVAAMYGATYNALNDTVSSTVTGGAMACGAPTAILDYPALDLLAVGNYKYNPPGGVWLYGVKPQQTSPSAAGVQLFNTTKNQYSQFGSSLFSL
jgi:hypothetical protein